MLQVSRDSNLKIPKKLENINGVENSIDDKLAVKQAIATADIKKFNKKSETEKTEDDNELEQVNKIPFNANDLMVITVVKKLAAYMIAVTEKSPKKNRGVFVNRMKNYCLDTLECLLEANFIRMDAQEKKTKREELQKEAVVKLKLLGYVSMVAESSGCILNKQYKQISIQLAEAINLTIAWKKSDDERWRKRS
ncbi:MAG: four helix bundle protein [Clostridia bacterium]|nr:four helix bundle protein [Clostridia bacterium]